MSVLPITKSPRTVSISQVSTLIHGIPGIGKSTWCSQIPNILGLLFEPGWNAIDGYAINIENWEKMKRVYEELKSGGYKNYGGICIDTIDIAYDRVTEYICRKNNVEHQSDMGYGKGWQLISQEFRTMLVNLSLFPIPLFLISHSKSVEIKEKTNKYAKDVSSLSGKPRDTVLGLVDIILYFTIVTTKNGDQVRAVKCKPNKYYEGKDRTGILPSILPMNYDKFRSAFEHTDKEEKEENKS